MHKGWYEHVYKNFVYVSANIFVNFNKNKAFVRVSSNTA